MLKGGVPSLHQPRSKLLLPTIFIGHSLGPIQFGTVFALLPNNNDSDTSTLQRATCQSTDTTRSSWPEINCMSSSWREIGSFVPMNGLDEDLIAQGARERPSDRT